MEKYAVNDRHELQEKELQQVKGRLKELGASHEKTASQTRETERLETRESELKVALNE